MRSIAVAVAVAVAVVVALAACSPPAPPVQNQTQAADAAPAEAARAEAPAFAFPRDALAGQWSFDRSCGLYDLVFEAGGGATFYDYANEGQVATYTGVWDTTGSNRVVMSLRRDGAGDAITYNLDIAQPITDDLSGHFARADGSDARDIAAKRCPEEDRD